MWPAKAFSDGDAPLKIGILGKNPFGDFLEKVVAGKKVGGHPITATECGNVEEAKGCHLVFVSAKEDADIRKLLDTLHAANVLTVSDASSFAARGGMIGLIKPKGGI